MSAARVLITGGAGFLGSHLADRLLAHGHQVRLLDNLDPQVHPDGPPAYLHPEVELQVGDVGDPAAVARALEGVHRVVHFAAVVGVGQSMYQPAHYCEVNLQGTAVLLQVLLEARQRAAGSGVERLLLAGSMSIYGEGRYGCPACGARVEAAARPLEQLQRQQWELACPHCGGPLDPLPTGEDKPAQLGSFYAMSKYVQEQMCLLFGRTYSIPTVVLRFFNTYGPRQALGNPYTGVAAVFAAELLAGRAPQVFEDGLQVRDLVCVHDVTAACALALEAPGVAGEVFNIASGHRLTVAGLARALARGLGLELEPVLSGQFRRGDARHCVADITAAQNRLGFRPAVGLEPGLGELTAWLRLQRDQRDQRAQYTPPHPSPAGRPRFGPPAATQADATAALRAYGLTG